MDLKAYYREIRTLETLLTDKDVVIVSNTTPDGGKAGTITEVPRLVACQLVVEGKARLASTEEIAQYRPVRTAAHLHDGLSSGERKG